MIKVQPKAGFHTGGGGGNLTGITSDYIIPVLAAGKGVTIVAADTTAGLYDAAVAVKNYQNTKSVLCWRRSDQRPAGGFDFDALANNFAISPEANAAAHYAAYVSHFPPELEPYSDVVEYIVLNEIRGQQTDEQMYQGLHIGEYLGRFALHYRTLTTKRLLFFGFASGEPEPDVWEQPSMLDFLRLCAERPYDTGIALHEYSYTVDNILDGYPFKIGRWRMLFEACTKHNIPWPRLVISEWGWTLDNVPSPARALDDIGDVFELEYGPYEQIAGAAIWWLGPGFGGIADKAQKLVKPLGDYIVATDYELELEQQPTQPPDGGEGEPVTKYKYLGAAMFDLITNKVVPDITEPVQETHDRILFHDIDADGKLVFISSTDYIPIPPNAKRVSLGRYHGYEEDENPNPPPVKLTLPQGSKGVDVSYWQGVFNWASSGAEFGIIRCSDGLTTNSTTHDENGVDRQFWANVDKLMALGIPWSFYHFLRPGSIQQQADKVISIINQLRVAGKLPRTAVFDNGINLPALWIDVEDPLLSSADVEHFYTLVSAACEVGIYTGKPVWNAITSGAAVWWSGVPLWIAAYGSNDGNVPNWPNGPSLPNGWSTAVVWQYSSNPIDKNIAGPYTPAVKPPDPPTGATVDLLPYFVPSGQYGQKIVIQTGTSTQPMQLEKRENDIILRKGDGNWIDGVKYQDSEQWRVKDGEVQKGIDTSDAGNGGRDGYDLAWAKWLPQIVEVGKTYHSTPMVRRFDRANCGQTTSTAQASDYLHVKALLPTWVSPANQSIALNDVLVVEWRSGTDNLNTPPNETYYFAKNIGYCGWGNHFIAEITQGQVPLTGKLDCGM